MRIWNALKADIQFQWKQGFYLVYVLLTIMYMVLLSQFSSEAKKVLVPIVVFGDPSLVGFFFIGGIVMLEKVQGILRYVVVTPLRPWEYLMAKVASLTLVAVAAGICITLTTYQGRVHWIPFLGGIVLTSMFFTLYGFVAAASCHTMNQFFIRMIPYLLAVILPCFSLIGFSYSWVFRVFPSVAGLWLVYGAFHGIGFIQGGLYMMYLVLVNIILLFQVVKIFDRSVIIGG